MNSLPSSWVKAHFGTSLFFYLISWMVLSDLRKSPPPGVYNNFKCLKIAPKHLLCSHVNWHRVVGFSSWKFLNQLQNCQWLKVLDTDACKCDLNSGSALSGCLICNIGSQSAIVMKFTSRRKIRFHGSCNQALFICQFFLPIATPLCRNSVLFRKAWIGK